jgi:hypothetical protein
MHAQHASSDVTVLPALAMHTAPAAASIRLCSCTHASPQLQQPPSTPPLRTALTPAPCPHPHRGLDSPTLAAAPREALSTALRDLLQQLLHHIASPDSAALGDATGAQALLSAATASKAGAAALPLPLLPQHAQQVLAGVRSSAAALEQAGWGADFRLLQLAAQLVPVAYGSPAAAPLSSTERGELEALLRWSEQQVELHADAAGGALPVLTAALRCTSAAPPLCLMAAWHLYAVPGIQYSAWTWACAGPGMPLTAGACRPCQVYDTAALICICNYQRSAGPGPSVPGPLLQVTC